MTKDIDVSKIDVGWRVQFDASHSFWAADLDRRWGTVTETLPNNEIMLKLDSGRRVHSAKKKGLFLAALPPEPAKDPFAVREWVVCVEKDFPCTHGDIIQVGALLWGYEKAFSSKGFGHLKSNFRPATPEEIAAHLEKNDMAGKPVISDDTYTKAEAECSPGECLSGSQGCSDAKDDGKITFTVAGREFFVGQRVWATFGIHGRCVIGDGLMICGELEGLDKLSVRKLDSHLTFAIHPAMVSAVAHEWCIGDICHGENPASRYIVLKVLENGVADIVCVSSEHPILCRAPVEYLTFLRRTDLGE